MMAFAGMKKNALLFTLAVLVYGCGISSSYRPAEQKTIRDFAGTNSYRKTVGVMVLFNTTIFTSNQLTTPFSETFLSSMESAASDAVLLVPGRVEVPPFLWDPPRIPTGDLDVFILSGLARQTGINTVVVPRLMDVRVRTRDTGFWIFKDVAYSLQIQTAAAIYDAITGTLLDLEILTDEVDIDEYEAGLVRDGEEVQVDDLVEVAEKMGESLGQRMGNAINGSKWLASVHSIEKNACVLTAGSEAGIQAGDRFAVLDGSRVMAGLDGQRYIVPGKKIGVITISRVTPQHAFGATETGKAPPVGSILIPER